MFGDYDSAIGGGGGLLVGSPQAVAEQLQQTAATSAANYTGVLVPLGNADSHGGVAVSGIVRDRDHAEGGAGRPLNSFGIDSREDRHTRTGCERKRGRTSQRPVPRRTVGTTS
jgi:hypothetical protein